jgi:hypothetical protein
MTKEYFDRGVDIDEYVASYRNYLSLVRGTLRDARADEERVTALKDTLLRFDGPVRASAFTEAWCGDWACNLAILKDLFARGGLPFRVFDGGHGALAERYQGKGVDHIPVVSLWDGAGKELVRWIEAPEAVQPLKDDWKRRNPRLMELYAIKGTDKDAENEFARLYRNLLEEMVGWYRGGMWNETMDEVIALAKAKDRPS